MMKHEFEERVNATVTEEQYRVIEYVYNWHPSIDNGCGKEQIATIYKIGGMRLIRDMYNTAVEAEKFDLELREIRQELEAKQESYERFLRGDL